MIARWLRLSTFPFFYALASLHPRRQPWITRQSYTHELLAAFTLPVALSMVEGGVVGVLARKAFDAPGMLFAAIMAAPLIANLTSFIWAKLAQGRRKVRFIVGILVAWLICVASIATLPLSPAGSWLLVVLVIISRCMISGVITLRSTVWRLNYPRRVRAQVTGKLALLNSLIIAIAPLAGYYCLDLNVNAFRWLYPSSCLFAMIGVFAFSRVRLRGERDLLRYERMPLSRPTPHGEANPIYEYDPRQKAGGGIQFFSVLKRDDRFRWYMICQFIAGMSMMMGETAVIYKITELTRSIRYEYFLSIFLSTALPLLLATLVMPIWAKHLDRVHISRFRVRQGWFWMAAQGCNWFGAMTGSLAVIALARSIIGIVRGGGMLAWQLGHNDFADRRMVAVYMGIHVTLTGVRGSIAPFLGIILLTGWSDRRLPLIGATLPGFEGIGHHVFLVTTALAAIATIGFAMSYRSVKNQT